MNTATPARRGVIKTKRAAAAPYNGVAALVLRDITAADGAVFNDKTPQVLAQVDGREHYFYADEVIMGDAEADGAKVRPDFIPDRLRHPATADQAAWDAAERQSTVQSMEQYLLAYPMGTHAQEARLRRSQIAPGLPPLPPLPQAMTDAMPAQAIVKAKDEDRNVPASGNHPEYNISEDQRKAQEQHTGIGTGELGNRGRNDPQPAANDEAGWKAASDMNTVAEFDSYLARYPSGAHVAEARTRRGALQTDKPQFAANPGADDAAWNAAATLHTVAGFDGYLAKYPAGAHSTEAKSRRAGLLPPAPNPPRAA